MMFCHLHAHSYYSLLEGLTSPADLVGMAVENSMPALALTDRNLLTGAIAFYLACQKAGVKPLIGLEVDMAVVKGDMKQRQRLVLLAADLTGWANLCRLSSAIHLTQAPHFTCSIDMVAQCAGGLVALFNNRQTSEVYNPYPLKDIFAQRLYIELVNPGGGQRIDLLQQVEAAKQAQLPVLATNPLYYLTREQSDLQRTLSAIRTNLPLGKLPLDAAAPPGAYFACADEMAQWFCDIPEALANVEEVVERCCLKLPLGASRYPQPPLPPGMTASDVLRSKAENGARERYGTMTPDLQKRLDHELEVIASRGYEGIFLVMEEVLSYAAQTGVPYSSRGSAASSLVAHCLGITSPDPLRLDLYFERFLNPERSNPPDIDTDLCSRRRDAVIQHVFDVYGEDHVAMVGTINHFRPRSALGEVAKAHGLPAQKVRALTQTLPHAFFHRMTESEGTTATESPYYDLKEAYREPVYRKIFEDAEKLLKLPRHLSVHAGGVVVSPMPLTDLCPVMRSGSKGIIITQLDLESVEHLGLVKMDLLGIRGLTVMGDVAEAVYSWRRSEFANRLQVLESIPWQDAEISQRIENGQTIGCFQIESPGMRATLRELHARSVDDIMAALALYRPGPLQGGLKDAFVRRHRGQETVSYLHPSMANLLADTHGVILYQEQVLRLAHHLAGFSLAESDLVRRAMSHFDPGRQMILLREKFVRGALERSSIPAEIAEKLWEMMAAFASYGFPKAHAASYAQVAWRSAWCKTYFPAEFMAAVMANWGGYYSQRVYLMEARRMDLDLRAPHVNHSQPQFSVAYPQGEPVLFMGMDQIRALTQRTQERLLRYRPFKSLEDLLTRVDPRRQEIENLALAGALEGLATIPEALDRLARVGWQPGQMSLFSDPALNIEDWSLSEKAAAQQKVLGLSLDVHPLELVVGQIMQAGAITTVDAAGRVGEKVCVAGVRQTLHRSRTSGGDSMAFMTLEDLDGALDVIIFPDLYRRTRALIASASPLLVSGMMILDAERMEPLLRAEKIEKLD